MRITFWSDYRLQLFVGQQERQLYEDVIDIEQDLLDDLPHKVMAKVGYIRCENGWIMHVFYNHCCCYRSAI